VFELAAQRGLNDDLCIGRAAEQRIGCALDVQAENRMQLFSGRGA